MATLQGSEDDPRTFMITLSEVEQKLPNLSPEQQFNLLSTWWLQQMDELRRLLRQKGCDTTQFTEIFAPGSSIEASRWTLKRELNRLQELIGMLRGPLWYPSYSNLSNWWAQRLVSDFEEGRHLLAALHWKWKSKIGFELSAKAAGKQPARDAYDQPPGAGDQHHGYGDSYASKAAAGTSEVTYNPQSQYRPESKRDAVFEPPWAPAGDSTQGVGLPPISPNPRTVHFALEVEQAPSPNAHVAAESGGRGSGSYQSADTASYHKSSSSSSSGKHRGDRSGKGNSDSGIRSTRFI